jgi:hypothetical protein
MSEIEKRARELLAAEYERYGDPIGAERARKQFPATGVTLRAIIAALTPPEGYVLVPEQLPVEMEVAFMEAWTSKRRGIDDPEMQDAWSAALAARPEVTGD